MPYLAGGGNKKDVFIRL